MRNSSPSGTTHFSDLERSSVGWVAPSSSLKTYGSSSFVAVDEDLAVVDLDRVAADADHPLDVRRAVGLGPARAG